MVWKVVLTIAEVILIGVAWLNWYLAVPMPFFIAFVLTLVLLGQVAERFSAVAPRPTDQS